MGKAMRLALFTDSNVYYEDGVARIVQELMKYIGNHTRHELMVFHRDNNGQKKVQSGGNVTVNSITAPYLRVPGYDAYPWLCLHCPKRKLLKMVRDFNPDVLLAVSPYVPRGISRSTFFVSKRLGTPIVGSFDLPLSWISEVYMRQLFPFEWAKRIMRRAISGVMGGYKRCTGILVPSESIARYIRDQYGSMNTILFPRAVDSQLFSPSHKTRGFKAEYGLADKIAILFVGRLALEKNLGALGEVYARLKERHENIALIMVGEGPERETLAGMELRDLIFVGALRGEELSRCYASADIFAFPSVADAGPMVVLEAMASGLPVVVMNGGGAKESVVNEETGLIAKNIMELEECLERFIENEGLRRHMGSNARRYAEDQNWQRIWDYLMPRLEEAAR
jgi:glycosyltransferase involved in cell wall biosynthesis